jgi:hypothetical protein
MSQIVGVTGICCVAGYVDEAGFRVYLTLGNF